MGTLLSFIDTDDIWQNNKIEKQISFFHKIKILKSFILII